jgi:hypothetical protein
MGERTRRRRGLSVLVLLALVAASEAAAKEPNVKSIAAGFGYDHFSRTVVWSGDDGAASKILTHTLAARAEIGLRSGFVFSLSLGLALTELSAQTFDTLPISLELGGASLKGFSLAAEAVHPVRKFGDFEIEAAGRLVYSFGIARSWPLEGFAVEGQATGEPAWIEVSAGPRVAYHALGRVVPFAEVSARLLWASFRMSETLGEITGAETKKVRGDFALAFAAGADVRAADRVTVRAKAGIMPASGGVDGLVSINIMYVF